MNSRIGNRLVNVIFLSQSFFSAGAIAIFAVISIAAYQLSGKETYAGLPTSVIIFTQALTALPVSIIINRYGWRVGLTLGYLIGGLGAFVGVLAVQLGLFWPLLLSGALLGIGRSAGELSRFAAGGMFEESKRAQMIGRVVFASAIGAVVGPMLIPISSDIVKSFGLLADSGAWVISVFLYALAAIVVFVYLRPDPNTVEIELKDSNPEVKIVKLLKTPPVRLAITSMVVSQLVMVVLMLMTPLHMHKLHHPQVVIAYIITAHALGMYGLSAVTGYLIDKFSHIPILLFGALVLICSAILALVSSQGLVVALAMFLLGLGWNFGYVAGSSLLSASLPQYARNKVQGINDTAIALIAAAGSLISGPIFFYGGYLILGFIGLIISFLLILVIFYNKRFFKKAGSAVQS